MIYFEHFGNHPSHQSRFRQVMMSLLVGIVAILLFPFTLLSLLLLGLWKWFGDWAPAR